MDEDEAAEILSAMLGLGAPEGKKKRKSGVKVRVAIRMGVACARRRLWTLEEEAAAVLAAAVPVGRIPSRERQACRQGTPHWSLLMYFPSLFLSLSTAGRQGRRAALPRQAGGGFRPRLRGVQGAPQARQDCALRPLREGVAPVLPGTPPGGAARGGVGVPRVPLPG